VLHANPIPMPSYSRREALRVDTPEGVRAYWSCAAVVMFRALESSFGGIFIETHTLSLLGPRQRLLFS